MEENEKVKEILGAARNHLLSLISARKSGTFQLTLEVNMSQGGIGDAFLSCNARERIIKQALKS
jgi:hypothetical protein